MSTRCQIGFYDKKPNASELSEFKTLLYKHSDGYPEGVMPLLTPFLKDWKVKRGLSDIEYVSARTLQYLCNDHDKHSEEMSKEYKHLSKEWNKEFGGSLGLGICRDLHWDIEYFYAIYPNGLDCYEVHYTGKGEDYKPELSKSELVESVEI